MLVLSRRRGEKILIDGGITVTVVEVRGDRVVLGIDAPEDVVVDREEIRERRHAANAAAATPQLPERC